MGSQHKTTIHTATATAGASSSQYVFDWADLAFGSKKPLKDLKAIFIMAPRELSPGRFTQLVQTYLPKAHIVLGISKEPYVLGLDGQPQNKMLRASTVQTVIDKVNKSASKHKIYTLHYSQRDVSFVLEKVPFARVVLVNGSWYRAFHLRPEYYRLANSSTPYDMVSPFADEQEARDFADKTQLLPVPQPGAYTETEMLNLAAQAAKRSFDFGGFQTGVVLGREKREKKAASSVADSAVRDKPKRLYDLLASVHNKVVPFETYAMHYGASREKNFSPMNDLNYYDTIHAEIALILKAQKQRLDLAGTTLFINLLPCPTCARMFTETDIAEFVYRDDHTDGYAVALLEKAGKKVRRIVPAADTTEATVEDTMEDRRETTHKEEL